MPVEKLVVFPDTNILLHYPPLKHIDWLSICDSESVKLVLCMQVIHELDGKKDDARLSERAQHKIKEISEYRLNNSLVRENVDLEIFNNELKEGDFGEEFSSDSKDDRIALSVKKYRRCPDCC
jgi:predicted ribonuclease YlaK